ncbi:hypothetical protein [Clostridium sp.]|uniref:hypothetical protein n=1 Tax=Clostridium sp. TaxID=1506 RepID=UPI002842053A|nr:hypothetical protein [Clostridium sp.]MDR3597424.1 hypothetical protein [Clostridium sp.]
MNKKIFTSFLITLILLVCTRFTQNAYAASGWQEIYTGWVYFENGTMKTGWILTNSNWYYIDKSGIMQTGWINDNGTWYYLTEDGSLNNAKTTTTMPSELVTAYNRIKEYANENINYSKTLIKDGDLTYRFYGESKVYPNEYYYTPGTDTAFQLKQGILTKLDTSEIVNTKYTYEQCKNIADAYFNNSHINEYKFTVNSDQKLNEHGEYYFTFYSTTTNTQEDSYYVSAINGEVRR